MKCCSQCAGLERLFDEKVAQDELDEYRKNGAAPTTRLLLDALKARGIRDLSLIDIGGGVGAIQHELLQAGAASAVGIDASTAYLRAAQQEAERRGHAEQVQYRHGDFVNLAPEIDMADIVTLDKVLCCYPDMRALVSLSVERARQYYGLVFPRSWLPFRLVRPLLNGYFRLTRNPYRFFLHRTHDVEAIIRQHGFSRIFQKRGGFWQVLVYERQ